jgi:predicted permease
MKTWLLRVALRLVPPDWRGTLADDLEETAEAEGRGAAWSAWQAARAGLRMRTALAADAFRFDVNVAVRALLHARWFTCGAILTFALGIGVNVAVFTAVDRMLFRELPYERPDEIVVMREVDGAGQPSGMIPAVVAVTAQRHHRGFLDLSLSGFSTPFSLSRESDDEAPLRLIAATHNTLEVFGVNVIRGRDFTRDDAQRKDRFALISFDAWQGRFGGAEDVVGRQLWSPSGPLEIIGVLPRQFIPPSNFLDPRSDGFVLDTDDYETATAAERAPPPYVRLRPGVSIEAAQTELDVLVESARLELPRQPNAAPTHMRLTPLRSVLFDHYTSYLWLIAVAASLVLAVACANLGSLMLVRNRTREHLAATHVALGASRVRLMRMSLIESALLSFAGAAVSLLVIGWSDSALRAILPPIFSRYAASVVDPRVLVFALLTAVVCTLVAGAYPSWRLTRVDVLGILQRGAVSTRAGRLRGSRTLLIVEAAFSLMLVAGAAVTVRSFATLAATDVGFQPDGLYAVNVSFPRGVTAAARFQQSLQTVDALKSIPGAVAAGAADINPLAGAFAMGPIGPGLTGTSRWQVTDGFFATMGMRLVAGRRMTTAEMASDAPVGVLSESGVGVVWPGVRAADAVGRMLAFPGEREREIVGVVSDVRAAYSAPSSPSLYLPLNDRNFRLAQFVVRMPPGVPPVLSDVRRRLSEAGVAASAVNMRDVEDGLRSGLGDQRFRAVLFSVFGITALILAAVGLYAVAANEAAQRQREVAIRLAIGGSAPGVQRLIVRQALVPVVVGIVLGIAGTYWAATFIQAFLHNVDGRDPAMLVLVAAVLLVSTGIAAWLPAYRAVRLNPAAILRTQ